MKLKIKKIKYKKFRFYKIIIVILLTSIMGSFVALGNFIIPLIVFFLAFVLMFLLQKSVEETINDERTYLIAGKASRIALTISTVLMAVAGIILVSLRNANPQYQLIGNILIYSECGMMLLYAFLFKYFSKRT